ncbi:mrna capping enzyme [Echinococcus multilocularis]|uniref:mRNA guanylyltransferase n=1 Tax=Echinococcus multilocularis TaxID=6211 RepID=A0A087W0Y6_ECHMU|nr:mrna capping enzyme [Echinococcus multilocularis]
MLPVLPMLFTVATANRVKTRSCYHYRCCRHDPLQSCCPVCVCTLVFTTSSGGLFGKWRLNMSTRRGLFFPPRWLKCPRVGGLLVDLFIPFKTPLDHKYTDFIPPDEIFDPDSLFDYIKPYQFGLVFDLTKSTRFYHRKEIEEHGCAYVKIACKGNEECPTEEQVNLFIGVVNNFVSKNKENGKKIGVHCTHGFNRTGFMIVAYLVLECNYSLELALKLFSDARPPGIYKVNYLMELYKRFDDPDDCPPAPKLPDWCYEETFESADSSAPSRKRKHPDGPQKHNNDVDDGNDGEDITAGSGNEDAIVSVSSNFTFTTRLPPTPPGQPKLMEDVIDVETLDQASEEAHLVRTVVDYLIKLGGVWLRSEGTDQEPLHPPVSSLSEVIRREPLSLPLNCDSTLRFRGSQPVSMTRRNARLIVDNPYVVTYKSDGIRYLMLVHGPRRVYLIDRGNFVYKVGCLEFPTVSWLQKALKARQNNTAPSDFMTEPGGHLVNTLLDGELVAFDNTPDRPIKFLVFDAVVIQGYPCGREPFASRLNYIERFIICPRNDAGHKELVNFTKQTFSVRKKIFYPLGYVPKLIIPNREELQHETDGLIFQPAGPQDAYVLGTCNETLKWKPPELNTIDFRCRIHFHTALAEVSRYVGELYLSGSSVPSAHLARVTSQDQDLNGKIVECYVDPTIQGWKVLRVRTDKTEPNHLSVGRLIMESILYPVKADDVIRLVSMRRQACMREKEGHARQEGAVPGTSRDAPIP